MPSDMTQRVVIVGVDGSEHAGRALAWAAEYAPLLRARVVVAHAFEPPVPLLPPAMPAFPPPFDSEWQAELRTMLDEVWCAPLRNAHVEYEAVVLAGDPAGALIEYADSVHASLIVVGRRGRNPMTELVLGSVSHRLTHHAPCPLVIVPSGQTAPHD
jgi:nucleotide-binding universal stress UspA family protein